MKPDKKTNILLVDDEPANLIALEATLEYLDQNLVKASSGQEALRCLLNQDFAVILLDVQMPQMNGIETATIVRERERSRGIPIIFLTGAFKTDEMMFKGYSTGAVDYLIKPVVSGILRAKVEVFVELALARQKLHEEIAERARVASEISKLNMILEQKNEDLTAANADLETFGYSVSHDLRAPLRHIQSYAALLAESLDVKLSETERDHMSMIEKSVKRMGQLIDDLLSFSRIGQAEMRKSRVRMDTVVQDTLSQLQPDISGRNIQWNIHPLPEVLGDPGLLRQVVFNLVSNSAKYTRPRDPAHIEIGSATQDNEVIFFFRDNGVGFDMNYVHKLFGVFHRLHSDREFEGTGIGLANVRRIIQRHGGRTWAEGKSGEGAAFFFSLPLAQDHAREMPTATAALDAGKISVSGDNTAE